VRFFLRIAPLLDLAVKALSMAPEKALPAFLKPAGVRAALSALGLDGLRALACASTAEGDHSVNDSYVLAPSPRRGLLAPRRGSARAAAAPRARPPPRRSRSPRAGSFGRLRVLRPWAARRRPVGHALPSPPRALRGRGEEGHRGDREVRDRERGEPPQGPPRL